MQLRAIHLVLLLCSVGTAVCEAVANSTQALPWHLTAGGLLLVATALGAVSKSILALPALPAARSAPPVPGAEPTQKALDATPSAK